MAEEKKSSLDAINEIVEHDRRYRAEAYFFLLTALEFSIEQLGERRHLTGQELGRGLREFAIRQYGLMAKTVLESWGVKTTDDFGEIVFMLVDAGILARTETDKKEDFHDLYEFDEAFITRYPFSANRNTREEF